MDAHRPAAPAGGYFGGLGGGSITSRAIQPLLDSDPRQIGPYAIRGRLGQGAMGHVYLAFAPTGPAYALKVLRPDFASDGDFRRRFAREISAARSVHSPFVNAVTDADPDAPTPWLASYFIPGPPLNAAVNLAGPFAPRSVAHLGVGIGLALQAIHTAGVVHRDLKPGNVLVASDGPRVIDFGIARAADASMLTSTGMRLGTPSFMAPEQVSGSNVGAAADVWAVGGMLVYAATGRTPFGDGNAMAILYRVENHEPDLEDLDPALAAIVERCLEKDPEARPTPAKLVELCRAALYGGAEGIPVLPGTDSTGWLPPAISRDLASRAVELASVRQSQVGIPVAPGAAAPAAGGGKPRGLLGRKPKGSGAPAGMGQVPPQGAGPQGLAAPQGAGMPGPAGPMGPQGAPQGMASAGYTPAPPAPQNYPTPPAGGAGQPGFGPQSGPQNYPAGPGPQNHGATPAAPPPTLPEGAPPPTVQLQANAMVTTVLNPVRDGAGAAGAVAGAGAAAGAGGAGTPGAADAGAGTGGAEAASAATPASAPAAAADEPGPAWAAALSHRAAEPTRDPETLSTPSDEAARGPAAGAMPWMTAAAAVVAESADEPADGDDDSADEPVASDRTESPAADVAEDDDEPVAAERSAVGEADGERESTDSEPAVDAAPKATDAVPTADAEPAVSPAAESAAAAFAAPKPPVSSSGGSSASSASSASSDDDDDADDSSTAEDLLSSFGSPAPKPEPEPEPAPEPATPAFAAPQPPRAAAEDHDVTRPIPAGLAPGDRVPADHDATRPIPADAAKWSGAKAEPAAAPWGAGSGSTANDATITTPIAGLAPSPATPAAPPVTHVTSPYPGPAGSAPHGAGGPAPLGPDNPALGVPMYGTPVNTGQPQGGPSPYGPGAPGASGFGSTPPPNHLTVVPPPPSMSSPYGQPTAPAGQPSGKKGKGGLPAFDRGSGAPGGAGAAPEGRTKRLALIVGVAVLAVGGIGAAAVAMSGGGDSKNTATTSPTTTSQAPATTGSQTPDGQQTTPSAPVTPVLTPLPLIPAQTGVPGHAAGEVGAQDVVLRGLYAAAADHKWTVMCSSISLANEKKAAQQVGYTGTGDPSVLCAKFYQGAWGAQDPARLRGVRVVQLIPGADAKHMGIRVNDPDENGNPTRTFNVSWTGTRWIIG